MRFRSPLTFLPTLLLPLACLLVPASAHAHDLQYAPPGSVEIDLGSAPRELLLHATLVDRDDEVVVTLRPPRGERWAVQALVPDDRPERDLKPSRLPQLDVESQHSGATAELGADQTIVDEGTGITYRLAAGEGGDPELLELEADTVNTIRISAPPSPVRIALRIFRPDGNGFTTADPEAVPRTFTKVRAWSFTPAPGSNIRPEPAKTAPPRFVAWFGAGVALIGVIVAVWWVGLGRRRSRERGIERASRE